MRPIEDIAREAGVYHALEDFGADSFECDRSELERFAAIVRAEALEEAARHVDAPLADYGTEFAKAIRALVTDQRDKPRG